MPWFTGEMKYQTVSLTLSLSLSVYRRSKARADCLLAYCSLRWIKKMNKNRNTWVAVGTNGRPAQVMSTCGKHQAFTHSYRLNQLINEHVFLMNMKTSSLTTPSVMTDKPGETNMTLDTDWLEQNEYSKPHPTRKS